jgi:hypothetical protein
VSHESIDAALDEDGIVAWPGQRGQAVPEGEAAADPQDEPADPEHETGDPGSRPNRLWPCRPHDAGHDEPGDQDDLEEHPALAARTEARQPIPT